MIERTRLEENYRVVLRTIAAAAERVQRDSRAITLVAVTKSVGVEEIRALLELGQRDFGESRIQQALPKIRALAGAPCRWHMIGHLQRNKAREAVEHFYLLHSLDSLPLARELARRAAMRQMTAEAFLEINVSGEASKHGVAPEATEALLAESGSLVQVTGLMTLAPFSHDPELSRPVFRSLRDLRDRLRERFPALQRLSMGMSQDYAVAVEEGADYVRVGTALFQ